MANSKEDVDITYEGWLQWVRVSLLHKAYLGYIRMIANFYFDPRRYN